MKIINPATGELLQEVREDDAGSVRDKCEQAKVAQRAWARRPYAERAEIIQRFDAIVQERKDELAAVLTSEVGKPITQSKNELSALPERFTYFLAQTQLRLAERMVATADTGTEERLRHEPLGVVANISAWNYPWFVGSNVFVPALLTGNAVLYKPSELSTLTGREMARALTDAGLPEHLFQLVVGGGNAGRALLEQPIGGVFFTGSYATGLKIAEQAARKLIPVNLELGGKDPAYVCEDVDVAKAAAGTADGAFYNTGQSCCAIERTYVHEAIWNEFVPAFVAEVNKLVVGDPTRAETSVGALARGEAALSDLEAQVADAKKRGARVLTGGTRRPGPGSFFEPTVLVDVNHEMAVMREESFGPIIGLMAVKDDAEALRLMNDTEYGLTASVYGGDAARAERLLAELDVGTAYFNCCDRVSPRLPWSGRRGSGLGCTLSERGIDAFLAPKAWHLRQA